MQLPSVIHSIQATIEAVDMLQPEIAQAVAEVTSVTGSGAALRVEGVCKCEFLM